MAARSAGIVEIGIATAPELGWVDATSGKVFCLVDAPDAEAAIACHREAHGLTADEIYEVEQG